MNRRPRTIRNKGVIAAAALQRTPPSGGRVPFQVDLWTRRLVRPLLIAALTTSVAVALLVVIRIVSPEQAWMAIAPLCLFAALEGVYTSAWLNNPDSRGVDHLTYRVAEILLLLVLARIYSWALFGGGIPTPEEMRLYLTSPISIISVGGFLTTTAVSLVAWGIAVSLGRTFTRLDVSIYEVGFYTLPAAEQKAMADDRPIQIPRQELQNAYLTTWLTIGMVMIALAALSTYEIREMATVTNPLDFTRLGLSPAMLFALLTYFLVGFWLLSHARLLRMNARWLIDGAAKEASLEHGWQRSSLAILLAIACIAAFLPIGSTLAISRILALGVSGFTYLIGLAVRFITTIFAASIMIFTGDVQEELATDTPEMTLPPLEEPVVPPPAAPNPVVEMVISSLFWALLIAFIVSALLYFLRERGYRIETGRIQGHWHTAVGWLRELWARMSGRVRAAGHELRLRLQSPDPAGSRPVEDRPTRPRFMRLGSLSPREQVRYYYLALVRRASERGVNRKAAETPLEYIQDLKEMWPEAEGDLEELTNAFLEARYSPRPIEKSDAAMTKERWGHVKSRLRGRK